MRLVLAILALSSTARAAGTPDFWAFWGDGKAELDGYALTIERYGERRTGTAVLVFVTEDFADDARVKADPGRHAASDVYPVMKLNSIKKFQTGIYDYSIVSSTFVKTEPDLKTLAKLAFSSTEWCGIVYEELLPHGDKLDGNVHSYFDGEGDQAVALPLPAGGLVEEQLPVVARGLRGEAAPGTVPFLPSAQRARLEHFKQAWGAATVTRGPSVRVTTALGTLTAHTVSFAAGAPGMTSDKIVFTVEDAWPHRILAWQSAKESGRILGSARLKYWELHGEGGERYLKDLGLPVPTGNGARDRVRGR